MISLNHQQMDSLSDASFRRRMQQVLAADPAAVSELDSEAGQRMLSQLVARARAYGFASELDIGRFVITAWILGTDFDTRFPAMREILADQRLNASQKADAMESFATTLMNTLDAGRVA